MKSRVELTVSMFFAMLALVPPASAANAPAITVGRVYAIEGDLLRYVPEENGRLTAVKDVPFGTGDTLYSGDNSRAELLSPTGPG